MKQKVLITGIDGFIGKHLGEFLLKNGYYVIGIGKSKKNENKNYASEFYTVDLLNLKPINVFKNIDFIIHLSAITEYNKICENPELALKFNLLSTFNLANLYINSKAKNFIYPSSGKVYGYPQYLPLDEKHFLQPFNFLGKYKKMGEEILEYFHQISEKNFTVLRIFNVYGPGQKQSFFIPKIIKQIQNNNAVTIGNINDKRDYIFIDDLIEAFKIILKTNLKGYNIFNVGSGETYSIKEILNIIKKITNKKFKVNINKNDKRKFEAKEEKANIDKLSQIGWRSQVNIFKGLRLMFK